MKALWEYRPVFEVPEKMAVEPSPGRRLADQRGGDEKRERPGVRLQQGVVVVLGIQAVVEGEPVAVERQAEMRLAQVMNHQHVHGESVS